MFRLTMRQPAAFVAGVVTAVAAVCVVQGLQVTAAPGDSDATFIPISPCRLMDTRGGAGGAIGSLSTFGPAATESVEAHGANGDCNLPSDAVALSLNVTALNATTRTFLTVWPDGSRPTASSVNPEPGEPPTPNAVTTQLAPGGSFRIYNDAGNVDVIVDVNGYYTSASLQELAFQVETLQLAAARILAGRTFIEHAEQPPGGATLSGARKLLNLSMVVPADGLVRVDYTTELLSGSTGTIGCSVRRMDLGSPIVGDVSRWSPRAAGLADSIVGSELFVVRAGRSADFELWCSELAVADPKVLDAQMIATFTAER